jgi:hypothetical protein
MSLSYRAQAQALRIAAQEDQTDRTLSQFMLETAEELDAAAEIDEMNNWRQSTAGTAPHVQVSGAD